VLNLCTILEESALRQPGKDAFVLAGAHLTYAEVDAASSKIAHSLQARGIGRGDTIAISCPNLPAFPIVYFAILKAGAVVVPLNILLKAREIAYHLQDSQAKAYFCFEGTPELAMGTEGVAAFAAADDCELLVAITVDPAAASPIEGAVTLGALLAAGNAAFESVGTAADDTAVILYTSGTTGQSKGAELSHSNLFMNARCSVDTLRYVSEDRLLLVLPLFHSFGQVVLMNAGILVGATMVLVPRFEPGLVMTTLEREGITVFAGVPTMYWALLHHEVEGVSIETIAGQLRLCASGGASLPLEVLRGFEEKFQVPILEGYGLSETSPVACFNRVDRERKPGSVGTPIWGVRMKIVGDAGDTLPPGEAGEIAIKGHNVMKGYYRRPEATAETVRDGWLFTGDIGQTDGDGFFYIVDRTKDMIIRSGFNVYPREIEELLLEHPGISLAAVVGVASDSLGEEIKAFVVPGPGAELVEDEVIAWSKERLAAYKYPRFVEVRDRLPMTATGKILKRALREG
jgi:long-chain acyl-CoA synthetase